MKPSGRVAALILAFGAIAGQVAFAQASAPADAATQASPPQDCKPQYPKQARRAGAQGVSVVAFQVDASGMVTGAEIVQSAGHSREHRLLDQETVRALSACKLTPGKDADGHPVASVVTVPYRWVLE